jgi:hypothetical protein
MPAKKALNTAHHSLHSSYREILLEHLFVGEVMRHLWVSSGKRLEILKPQVDDAGYDLVLELGKIVRHIQLKTSFEGSTVQPARHCVSNRPLRRETFSSIIITDRTTSGYRTPWKPR